MSVLSRIFEAKRAELAEMRIRVPLADVMTQAQDAEPPRHFLEALKEGFRNRGGHRPSLIAEVKKASPSKGVIRGDFDPVQIANAYAAAGADCLSVLTDAQFFQGSPDNLIQARRASGLPTLRKDFTTDVYHVYEARAMGADAVLLIVNGLHSSELKEYRELAETLGMDALVEAHTLEEAETALDSGASLIGINNRDLVSFDTCIEVSETVIPLVADRAFVVSESALLSYEDVSRVHRAGAQAVLIGTAFTSAPDIEAKVHAVMHW